MYFCKWFHLFHVEKFSEFGTVFFFISFRFFFASNNDRKLNDVEKRPSAKIEYSVQLLSPRIHAQTIRQNGMRTVNLTFLRCFFSFYFIPPPRNKWRCKNRQSCVLRLPHCILMKTNFKRLCTIFGRWRCARKSKSAGIFVTREQERNGRTGETGVFSFAINIRRQMAAMVSVSTQNSGLALPATNYCSPNHSNPCKSTKENTSVKRAMNFQQQQRKWPREQKIKWKKKIFSTFRKGGKSIEVMKRIKMEKIDKNGTAKIECVGKMWKFEKVKWIEFQRSHHAIFVEKRIDLVVSPRFDNNVFEACMGFSHSFSLNKVVKIQCNWRVFDVKLFLERLENWFGNSQFRFKWNFISLFSLFFATIIDSFSTLLYASDIVIKVNIQKFFLQFETWFELELKTEYELIIRQFLCQTKSIAIFCSFFWYHLSRRCHQHFRPTTIITEWDEVDTFFSPYSLSLTFKDRPFWLHILVHRRSFSHLTKKLSHQR